VLASNSFLRPHVSDNAHPSPITFATHGYGHGQLRRDILFNCFLMRLHDNTARREVPESHAARRETGPAVSFATGTTLLDEALRVRKGYEYVESPTSDSHFILPICCYFGLDKHNTAWFYLREATTLAQILGMQDESNYRTGDLVECSRRRRLYWLLFVTER
jgi:hypothetical protein